jgi:hypothetical protein
MRDLVKLLRDMSKASLFGEAADRIEELERQLAAAQTTAQQDSRDADLWRGLIGSARIRPLGCAGIKQPEERGYAHLGMELWTVYGTSMNDEQLERVAKENALGVEWLTKYATISAAMQSAKEGKS